MSTFAFAVRTVPARRELFLPLAARLGAMTVDPRVVGLAISEASEPETAPNENGCLALEAAVASGPDWVLFLEDDAGPIDDLVGSVDRWLDDHAEPDGHLYPLGSPLGVDNVPALR